MKMNKKELRDIENALQQMTGFKIGKWDGIYELVVSMGLSEKEWNYIKKNQDSGYLDDKDIEEIDEYFKELSQKSASKHLLEEKK